MRRDIEVIGYEGAVVAGLYQDGVLTDVMAEPAGERGRLGAVHCGRVERVDAIAGACFLDIGLDRPAFLKTPSRSRPPRAGDLLPIQVTGTAREEKGPSVTMDIALPGRFLVHLPFGNSVSVSRRLGPDAKRVWRNRLSGGWIVRAAASAADPESIETEISWLRRQAAAIVERLDAARAPALLLDGPDAPRRMILDAGPDLAAVRLESRALDPHLFGWLERAGIAVRLDLGDTALADHLPELLEAEVLLPSGGSIIIEPTRALIAVDVNAGAARDKALANREAARAIARHLRLRNLGGLVVVDFISASRREEAGLFDVLKDALADDPATITTGPGISSLGLVELARERRGLGLAEALGVDRNMR